MSDAVPPADLQPSGRERVRAAAAALGLDVELVERPPARSLHEAAELLGIEPADIVKTIVVKRRSGDYLFALVPGGRKISWPPFRTLLGVNKLAMPDAATAFQATGYERGTITVLGASTPLPVYADERILERGGRISIGAGEHGWSAFVDAAEYLTAIGAVTADLTEPEDPQS
ncbi:aminoacyl-tRNA deacylase [Plantibacter cousiniae (nom. nud.)]|uniref:Cys-tRNA(Pro) deacylase, prolyl-tRNA editing enzyme YbaK/EbsC n=1 Tax=Plantibacter cousiniae (nom. nud.) TaxID=199709 RepID=A0ABY1LPQ6_9MICO|nr:YbaK/EbsC family protein [Plantibacter cousiniae]SKC56658.1 Cys-tRNA(Pro) deacylase, prolyl-tRNA editing enzyme YbaK/EbsC [Plantibacter cousiniae]